MANCSSPPTGLPPIPDIGPPYMGTHPGGLYVGTNSVPALHAWRYRALALEIEPLDRFGRPAPVGAPGSGGGEIGFVGLGFSNGQNILKKFVLPVGTRRAVRDVNLCAPGADASILANAGSAYWKSYVPMQLAAAGMDAKQVQVAWIVSGEQAPPVGVGFPANIVALQAQWVAIVQNALAVFPNLKIAYLDSPTYGGYNAAGSTEPWNYEQGYAVQGVIAQQIGGDPALAPPRPANWPPPPPGAPPPVPAAPLLLWGLCLWCDGLPRTWDGLDLICPADVNFDGHHLSPRGSEKYAGFLSARLGGDVTAGVWLTGFDLGAPPASAPPVQVPG